MAWTEGVAPPAQPLKPRAMNPRRRHLSRLLLLLTAWSCDRSPAPADFVVVGSYPHDPAAYTQGLVTVAGTLYESIGLYGYSEVRRIQLETGVVQARHALTASQFGEGLAFHDGRLYQLTWREGVAYVYLPDSLTPVDSVRFPGEGWGLASDGTNLFLSDGSDSIRVLNPHTFAVERSLKVRYGGLPLSQLNKLEFFNGSLFANLYGSDRVAMLDPQTGVVTRLLDFELLYTTRAPRSGVMNGIAVDPDGC